MAERIRGGKLTVLNPVPPIRRVWLRASQALSAQSQILLILFVLDYRLTLYLQGDSYLVYLKRLDTT